MQNCSTFDNLSLLKCTILIAQRRKTTESSHRCRKALDKIWHLFIIKILNSLEVENNVLKLIQRIYKKSTTSIILKVWMLTFKTWNKAWILPLIIFVYLSKNIGSREKKRHVVHVVWKGGKSNYVYSHTVCLERRFHVIYIKAPRICTVCRYAYSSVQFCSVQFSCSVVSESLLPHGLQCARPPCPSQTPRAYSYSCPSSQWCHPTISSSVVPFSSCL